MLFVWVSLAGLCYSLSLTNLRRKGHFKIRLLKLLLPKKLFIVEANQLSEADSSGLLSMIGYRFSEFSDPIRFSPQKSRRFQEVRNWMSSLAALQCNHCTHHCNGPLMAVVRERSNLAKLAIQTLSMYSGKSGQHLLWRLVYA